jgi:hypothetical protein
VSLDRGMRLGPYEIVAPLGAGIDYPVWSPTGGWVLFDRFRPQGGDIWSLEQVD